VYLKTVVLGLPITSLSREKVARATERFSDKIPYWEEFLGLVPEAQREVAQGVQSYAFADVERILQRVTELMGARLGATSCQDLRGLLLQAEDHNGTGRVRLRDFYASAVDSGAWQFQESISYLRQMGMLDESDASQPRVIIANFLYMHADCIEGSRFHDYCCTSPCEALMSQLERSIRAPYATLDEILSLVSAMPAPSASSNRTLAPALVRKLEDVANHSGGLIPLHGRLFAQWMHFAYPHECPYPHMSGTTTLSLAGLEGGEEAGFKPSWSHSEMRSYMESLPDFRKDTSCDMQDPEQASCPIAAMWAHDEEHVDAAGWTATVADRELALQSASRFSLHAVMLVACLLSSVASMLNHVRHGLCSHGIGGIEAGKVEC